LLFVEEGVEKEIGGLQGDYEYYLGMKYHH
jgi:hypothetical protein